ncbi:MAG: Rieske (2Fe-2S) protein [Candidatus Dormibacteraceae bacterium]
MSTGVGTARDYRVGPAADVPEEGGILVQAGGLELGLFKVRGSLHAYENRCRHQGGPVCTGDVIGRFQAVVNPDGTIAGERFADDEVRIACPWHGWEYDLETGACTADARFRLRRFEVSVRDGDVYVRV